MRIVTSAITLDREFYQATIALDAQLAAERALPLSVNGLADGARDAFLVEMVRHARSRTQAPLLVIAAEETEARAVTALLSAEGLSALYYPARDYNLLNVAASHETERERLSVLCRLQSGAPVTVVTTAYAALQYTVPAAVLSTLSVDLAPGDEMPPERLAEVLVRCGFARVELLDGVGQFARRGGIFDVWPAGAEAPVRIEFFGDEIDRMGYFDPLSQRVDAACERLSVVPAREVLIDADGRAAVLQAERALAARADADTLHTLATEVAMLEAEGDVLFADRYLSLVYPNPATLFDHITADRPTVTLVLSEGGARERTETQLTALAEEGTGLVARGLLSAKYNRFAAELAALDAFLERALPIYISAFGHSYKGRLGGLFGFRSRRTVSYFAKPLLLKDDIRTLLAGYYRVLVVTETAAEAEATVSLLAENDIRAFRVDGETARYEEWKDGAVWVTHGALSSGFELIVPKVAILTTLPDEGTRRRRARRAAKIAKRAPGKRIMSYADLSPGDFVVHTVHGIGVFEGMEQITQEGVTRDYITLRYAGTDRLFLPADRLEMIAKYIGAGSESGKVKLSKLGGADWQRARSRAKASAKDMAKELVALYAARQRKAGYAFPEECEMEREFADAFEFEETEPQTVAISEILGDMMRPVPMDRLLCGDVGFGKTEVALRAAFKAMVAGKQVAILVPTTILAMQHYQTALSRMRGYPVNVEMLSRLRSPREQQSILRRLKRGEIDLIVGTHSLLSSRVAFKDLGLLIVDEEQRFGVGQKEKLKALATDVDVLTLTATPIPRTLNMAMSGIRDMSVLDEAPSDRQPVQTYVMEHDDIVIEEAVRKELSRGGQVLYLYNRVESMERPAARLSRAFPDAHITAAHGKMSKEELEDIWQALVRGEIDVLVCTTIIETGVDLPNANTLIIEDADRMGLSQLHQLRGRVGRSGRRAYAYFTYRRGKELSEVADKRLKTIREYAEFGAGFKIALRDLEIRGAGNLLGAEQHGHIDAVGYDLYVKILNEAILEEKGVAREETFEAQIDIAVNANIPERFIRTSAGRMEMYKKISLITDAADMSDVLDEICDRYGEPPVEVQRLLWVATARAYAATARISKIDRKDGELRFHASPPDLGVWSVLFAANSGLRFTMGGGNHTVVYRLGKGEDAAEAAYRLMRDYVAALREPEQKE